MATTTTITAPASTPVAYILIADGDVDQVCETASDAARERRNLIALGCTVKIRRCAWINQDTIIDQIDGRV